ncbi:MAG: hydroxyacylglutathione hydrolase [Myxococcota bacterium]
MLVERIWTNSPLRNLNYVIACSETGEALVLDPLDHVQCLAAARSRGWDIRQILNTHEHRDHTQGNEPVRRETGATLLAHENAKDAIPGIDRGLKAGDVVRVGKTVELECLDTPGHTFTHICLHARSDRPALFSGDTLFNAGVGNCRSGDPRLMYASFAEQLNALPDETEVFPGHDYIASNLRFTLDREPENERARALLEEVEDPNPETPFRSTLALEREINTFLRLRNPSVITRLRERFPNLPSSPDPETVFLRLRELRDHW